jgi:hypothetical protein
VRRGALERFAVFSALLGVQGPRERAAQPIRDRHLRPDSRKRRHGRRSRGASHAGLAPFRTEHPPGLTCLSSSAQSFPERWLFIPGKPWQNGTDESFNGPLRDECLSVE